MLSSQSHWAMLLKSRFMRHNKPIGHYTKSSIWSGVRQFINTSLSGSCWQLGDGSKINLWRDQWSSYSLYDMLQLPDHVLTAHKAKVKNFFHNQSWFIPSSFSQALPAIAADIQQITIPVDVVEDHLICKGSISGSLSFKEAYSQLNPICSTVSWAKRFGTQ